MILLRGMVPLATKAKVIVALNSMEAHGSDTGPRPRFTSQDVDPGDTDIRRDSSSHGQFYDTVRTLRVPSPRPGRVVTSAIFPNLTLGSEGRFKGPHIVVPSAHLDTMSVTKLREGVLLPSPTLRGRAGHLLSPDAAYNSDPDAPTSLSKPAV